MHYLDAYEPLTTVTVDGTPKRTLRKVGVVWINRRGWITLYLRNEKLYLFEPNKLINKDTQK